MRNKRAKNSVSTIHNDKIIIINRVRRAATTTSSMNGDCRRCRRLRILWKWKFSSLLLCRIQFVLVFLHQAVTTQWHRIVCWVQSQYNREPPPLPPKLYLLPRCTLISILCMRRLWLFAQTETYHRCLYSLTIASKLNLLSFIRLSLIHCLW